MFYIEKLEFLANYFLDPEVFWGMPILLAIVYALLQEFGPENTDTQNT